MFAEESLMSQHNRRILPDLSHENLTMSNWSIPLNGLLPKTLRCISLCLVSTI